MNNAPNQLPSKQTLHLPTAISIIAGFCFVLTLFIYRPFGLYFLNDDLIHIPWSGKGIFIQQGFLRCVHNILSYAEIKAFGNSPTWFHVVSLLMHLICACLVYVLSKQIFTKYSSFEPIIIKPTAILAASFFMVYAFHSEGVLWIIGSVSVMSTLFFLLCFICYFNKEKSIFYFLLSLLLYVIALLTYENVWVMPVIVWFFWYADAKKNNNYKGWVYPALVAVVFLIHLYIRVKILGKVASAYETGNVSHFNITVLFLNFNRLIARSFLPPMQSAMVFTSVYGAIILFIIYRSTIVFKKNKLDILTVVLSSSVLCSYLPVVSLGIDTHSTASERYIYLPSVFLCMLMAYLLIKCNFLQKTKIAIILLIVCFNVFFALSSSADYHLASQLSKDILYKASNKITTGKTYYVYGLPATINKVKVLDIGFKEGMAWLYNKDSSTIKQMDNIEVLTKTRNNKPISFKIITVDGKAPESNMQILLDTAKVTFKPYLHNTDEP